MANDNAPETHTDGETRKRVKSVDYTYIDLDGKDNDSFTDEVAGVVATLLADKRRIRFHLDDIAPDIDLTTLPAMFRMAAVSGLKNTLINAANSPNAGDDLYTALETRRDTIIEGQWRDDTRGGPNLKYVIEAVANVIKSSSGKDVPTNVLAQIKADIKAKGSKFFLDNATIRAEYDASAARRAAEAAAKSAELAGKAPSNLDSLLGSYV